MSRRTDLAWAAGVFDGEGCISIVRIAPSTSRCTSFRYVLTLKVTMGHLQTIRRLRKIFDVGSVQSHVAASDRVNASFSWVCQSKKAGLALRLMMEFLVTKQAEGRVALKFLALPLAKRGGPGGSLPANKKLMAKREKLYWKLRKLKSRWRFYEEKL